MTSKLRNFFLQRVQHKIPLANRASAPPLELATTLNLSETQVISIRIPNVNAATFLKSIGSSFLFPSDYCKSTKLL